MTVKATKSCVQKLIAKGVNVADIMIRNPKVILDIVDLQNLKIRTDFACQVDTTSSSSESLFGKFLEYMDVTETELDTLLAESDENNLMSDPIECICTSH